MEVCDYSKLIEMILVCSQKIFVFYSFSLFTKRSVWGTGVARNFDWKRPKLEKNCDISVT